MISTTKFALLCLLCVKYIKVTFVSPHQHQKYGSDESNDQTSE